MLAYRPERVGMTKYVMVVARSIESSFDDGIKISEIAKAVSP